MELDQSLFWDTDYAELDEEKHKRHIIYRVFTRGDLPDIKAILKRYGRNTIKKEVVQFRSLDTKTLNFLSVIFDLEKEQFRCYTTKQFNQPH